MADRGASGGRAPLGFALAAAARKLGKFYARALADGPVTPAQLALLRQLWAADGQQLRPLSARAGLDATSATWLVDQLEGAGLVERRRAGPDRRAVRVGLTDAGRRLEQTLTPELARWEAAIGETLATHHTAAEIATFRAVLVTITAALPDGDDLWATHAARWETALDALKAFVEADEQEGATHDDNDGADD